MDAITIGTTRYAGVREAMVEVQRLYSIVGMSRENYQAACVELGTALLSVRDKVEHGQWGRFLMVAGIHAKTAQRAMRLAVAREQGLKAGMGDAPALEPWKGNHCDKLSHEHAATPVSQVYRPEEFEPIINPEFVRMAAEDELVVDDEPDDVDDGLDDEDEIGDDLPGDGADLEDSVGMVDMDGESSVRVTPAAPIVRAGEQLSMAGIWEEIEAARKTAFVVRRLGDEQKSRMVEEAEREFAGHARRFHERVEEIRNG